MPTFNPETIKQFLEANAYRMDVPVQYLGDEPNAYRKVWDETTQRWLLIASWPYETSSGNLSIPVVYAAVNDAGPGMMADRFYLPATPRDFRMLERADIGPFGIESKQAARSFDVVATSISYSVLILSFHKMLQASGIPTRWKARAEAPEAHPFVLVGGQIYGASESVSPIVDALWCGEVEEEAGNPGMESVCRSIQALKDDGIWATDREEAYRYLAREFNFLYFPRFVNTHYDYELRPHVSEETPSRQVVGIESLLPGMRMPLRKRHVHDLDAVTPLTAPPLLYTDMKTAAGDLEVGRGCPAWCSFCALTYRQKPYRQRSVEFMVEYAKEHQRDMGGVHLTPFSPDFPMHTQKKRLIKALLEEVCDEVDASSMRVDDFIADPQYILLQAAGGMDSVTLGVEGNSQRMRDLVGKGCSDEDIREAVARGIRAGIRKFKLYMIANLPSEDEGDVYRILQLGRDLANIRDQMGAGGVQIQFSWTPLLIDSNTPFQWFAPTPPGKGLLDIWDALKELNIQFRLGGKTEINKLTMFQACQRCSVEVGEAICDVLDAINVPHKGGTWGGVPKSIPGWPGKLGFAAAFEEALRARGFHNGTGDIWDERFKADMFGWEHIDQGVNPELLWIAYTQMREFAEGTDSETYDLHFEDNYHGNEWIERCDTKCYGKTCSTCNPEDLRIRRAYITDSRGEVNIDLTEVKPIDQTSLVMRVRSRIEKDAAHRFVTNDHWRFAVRRAAYQTGLPITKRSLRFVSDQVKWRDWTSGADYVEFGLLRMPERPIQEYLDEMNARLNGVQFVGRPMTLAYNATELRRDIDLSLFSMEVDKEPSYVLARLAWWESQEFVPLTIKQLVMYPGDPDREEVNGREFVQDMWLVRDGHRAVLRMLLRGRASPYDVYAALTEKPSWVEAARYPAHRDEVFIDTGDDNLQDFFRPTCQLTDRLIPVNPMDQPYDPLYAPRARDEVQGLLISEATL